MVGKVDTNIFLLCHVNGYYKLKKKKYMFVWQKMFIKCIKKFTINK